MRGFVFFLFFIGVSCLLMKVKIRTRFDYDLRPMAFFRPVTVIAAVLFWLFLLLVGIFVSDPKTTAGVLGVVTVIYAVCVVFRLRSMYRMKRFKARSILLPGRIVGQKSVRKYHRGTSRTKSHFYTVYYLIVEYEDPHTHEKRELVTESVNGNPFYCLSSLDVTVYYQSPERIWVEDFRRSRDGSDNIASQVTGDPYGKDPGVLRYE